MRTFNFKHKIFSQATFALAKVITLHASCQEEHRGITVASDYNNKLQASSLGHIVKYTNYPLPYISCKPCVHAPLSHLIASKDVVNQYADSSSILSQNIHEASQVQHVSLT